MTIDWWTLGFQTVNVAILIWLLQRFFWKPVAGMIEARRVSAQTLIDDAKATSAKAAQALAEVEKTRAGFAEERQAILAAAHQAGAGASAALLAKATIDADARQAAAKISIAKDSKAQESAWADRSADLAIDVAGRLAARLGGAAVEACFLDWLLAEIRKLPEAERKAAETLELASAIDVDAGARERLGAKIAEALGGQPQIAFRTDSKLIAGFELRGAHLIIDSSWRADLATIHADLAAVSAV